MSGILEIQTTTQVGPGGAKESRRAVLSSKILLERIRERNRILASAEHPPNRLVLAQNERDSRERIRRRRTATYGEAKWRRVARLPNFLTLLELERLHGQDAIRDPKFFQKYHPEYLCDGSI